ncbi:hypothetical protein BJF78_26805 [Pseudonocardia sp. CNS-139]|nr:hypothetical protein BJF78_26805 [Pseudonocardia sp. CNS-139]
MTDPATDVARGVIERYVSAINERRYPDALAVFHPDSDAVRDGLDAWVDAHSTTRILDPTIHGVSAPAPDRLEVLVTFTSTQDPSKGPEGQACTRWDLAYDLVGPEPDWQIRRARLLTPLLPC